MRSRRLVPALIASGLAAVTGVALCSPTAVSATTAQRAHANANVSLAFLFCRVGFFLHQGKKVYAAVPASCTALPNEEGAPQDGCTSPTAPLGTPATVKGFRDRAVLVYDSFTWMQGHGEKSNRKCHFNDLALLKLSHADAMHARSAVPGQKAPQGVASHAPSSGSTVAFGKASATIGGTSKGGWVYTLSTTPTVRKGDVGTQIMSGGQLLGMLTAIPQGTVMKTPAASYNVARAIRIAKHSPGLHHLVLLKTG